MAWIDHDARRVLLGVAIGAGALLTAPLVGTTLAAITRPLVKAVLKRSILTAERSRERLALLAEGFEDIVAEVRSEVEEELSNGHEPAAAPRTEAERRARSALS